LSKCLWLNWLHKQHLEMKPPNLITNWFSTSYDRMTVIRNCHVFLAVMAVDSMLRRANGAQAGSQRLHGQADFGAESESDKFKA